MQGEYAEEIENALIYFYARANRPKSGR